jgi:phosphoglycolate phosphatase
MTRLIALDLDGTLEDSRLDMIAAVHRVRARFHLPARVDDAIRPWVNQGMEQLYRNCFDDYVTDDARYAQIEAAYETDYSANVAVHTRAYPGIPEALATLKEWGQLVVVTNKPDAISRRLLEALRLDAFVSDVVGPDCGAIKPNPLMLQTAAARIGLSSTNRNNRDAFMIGDTAGDIKMGRAFGATTVWCAWGYMKEPGETPDHIARVPADLPALIISSLRI